MSSAQRYDRSRPLSDKLHSSIPGGSVVGSYLDLTAFFPDLLSGKGSEPYSVCDPGERIVGDPEFHCAFRELLKRGQDRRVGASYVVVTRLAEAVMVQDAPVRSRREPASSRSLAT
jgi:hypothetical protein